MAEDKIRPAREEATGTSRDEALAKDMEAWFANVKRTYDAYQTSDTETLAENRAHREAIRATLVQALQNAVETANMVSKQAIRHGDVAIDGHWNPVQQGAGDTLTARAVSIDDASLKALGVTLAVAVAQALNAKPAAA